jgi:ABC-type nitrate/sulfonate/bicarbonate transport system substrate-binding protein
MKFKNQKSITKTTGMSQANLAGEYHANSWGKPALSVKTLTGLLVVLALVLSMGLGLTGCQGTSDGRQKITVVLDWVPNTNHIGLYAALESGFFDDEGLNVEIVQAPEMNFIEMVGVGTAQFGICGQEQLSLARTAGKVPVVAIGAILQQNTSGFASPTDRGILSPADFEGKIYSGWGTPLEERFIRTLMEKDGANFSKVTMRMMGATDYFASMETEADFAWIYYGWDGIGAQIRDYPIHFILLQDIDPNLNFYSPVLISNERFIAENPETVRKFMAAVSKGYHFAVENPEEACDMLLIHTPETGREHAIESVRYLSDYFLNEQGRFGVMKQEVWSNFSQWMQEQGLLDETLDIESSYTNDYLPAE